MTIPRIDRRAFLRMGAVGAVGLIGAGAIRFASGQDDPSAPPRKELFVHSKDPPNGEPALEQLADEALTPFERFFVRNHGSTPTIDVADYRLEISGLVRNRLAFSYQQLNVRFRPQKIEATLTCAGNRRSEHSLTKQVEGVPWGAGAIGNARWTGVPLSVLLRAAEVKEEAKHVWFEGLDSVKHGGETIAFGGSIPIDRAMAGPDEGGALIAYQMNGRPLGAEHGYPARAIVPGYIGARSVKWLGRIVVSDRPSDNHFLQGAYKIITGDDPEELAKAPPIYEFPINAAICVPASGAMLTAGTIDVRGYALAPGEPDRTIDRVELSSDGGTTWTAAEFTSPARAFAWRLWKAKLPVTPDTRELIVRAIDSKGDVQPERVDWNAKGYLYNGWHRVGVRVDS
jgi:sulfite oxidase